MAKNPGRNPFHNPDDPDAPHPRVDLRFRNGWVIRNADPKHYRWKPWPGIVGNFDVTEYQESVND